MQTLQICHRCYSHNSLICLETKDELKGLGTMKWEVHSTNVYMEKEKYNPLVFLDQKHETITHHVQHWCRFGEEKKVDSGLI